MLLLLNNALFAVFISLEECTSNLKIEGASLNGFSSHVNCDLMVSLGCWSERGGVSAVIVVFYISCHW